MLTIRATAAAAGSFMLAMAAPLPAAQPASEPAPPGRVELVEPVEQVAASTITGYLKVKLANLARINPANPAADSDDNQTLSLFGREDLIAATSAIYRPTKCVPLPSAPDVLDDIARRATDTSVVIINESHEHSDHRGFTAEVAHRLRPLGYDALAIETLVNDSPDVPEQFRAPFVRQPALPYLTDDDGYYSTEAGFGRLGRAAKALGYHLIAYEIVISGPPVAKLTRAQSIAEREEAQATTLAAFLKANPGTKLLVHVGYSHAMEVPTKDGITWMAARLKAKTGIDPLTISQTTCRGGSDTTHLAELPADEPKGAFDLVVDHPTARFVQGRPAWRVAAGDQPVAIPAALVPKQGWRVIEARPVGEPDASVPIDRVAIRAGNTVALMLPPGRYALRVIDVARPKTAAKSRR